MEERKHSACSQKKSDKQSLNNYRSVSLQPILAKIIERLFFNEMFSFFIQNDLINKHQSDFKLGDSCINHLLTITHEMFQSFDQGIDLSRFFLEISKAFDKVWHDIQTKTELHIG